MMSRPIPRRLTNRRVFAQFSADEGVPDGLTVDAEGFLWCAQYGAGRISRFAPDGKVERAHVLPCPVVTAPAFGGPSMTTLFVTTGWSPGVQAAEAEPGSRRRGLFSRNRHQRNFRAYL